MDENARKVKIKDPYRMAMRFDSSTIMQMIKWLDDSFIAITSGEKIQVPFSGTVITIAGKENQDVSIENRLVLVVNDKVNNRIVVVGVGQWVVSGSRGIEVYNNDEISTYYDFVAFENEDEVPPAEFRS